MNLLENHIAEYLEYCQYRKHLDSKTLKAYRIDLKQYAAFSLCAADALSRNTVDCFITSLHKTYKSKTVKRKIASLKAFFHYLEYRELLEENPFSQLDIRFREPKLLPKTIPFHSIQKFLAALYKKNLSLPPNTSCVAACGILPPLNFCLQPVCVYRSCAR